MISFLIFVCLVSYASGREAIAVIVGNGTNSVSGEIYFSQSSSGAVSITGSVSGLTTGLHGFHIHAYGSMVNGCGSTGDHYNPHNVVHGGKNSSVRHVGDLGNIDGGISGVATINIIDNVISLTGDNSIIGRAVVVHENEDDLGLGGHEDSLSTGRAGPRIGCGIIGLISEGSSGSYKMLPAMVTTAIAALFTLTSRFI